MPQRRHQHRRGGVPLDGRRQQHLALEAGQQGVLPNGTRANIFDSFFGGGVRMRAVFWASIKRAVLGAERGIMEEALPTNGALG